jgi:DNA-binding PadR family transcriptional regulator
LEGNEHNDARAAINEGPGERRPHIVAASMILGILDSAASPMSRGELGKRLKTKAAVAARLTSATIAEELELLRRDGLVASDQVKRSVQYGATDSGRAFLRQHPAPSPTRTGGRINPATNDDVLRSRHAEILLHLLEADAYTLNVSESNTRLRRRQSLELNAATADAERQRLGDEGLIEISGTGRGRRFTLAPAGRLRLGAMTFYESFQFRLRGKALNDLLDAAREAAKEFGDDSKTPTTTFERADVERAIVQTFEELARERHAVHGMVPIHEIRAGVRRQFGDAAARHDLFDPVLLEMRRRMRWRMIPISDRSRATAEELQDAVPGVGETLFYLEAERVTAAR